MNTVANLARNPDATRARILEVAFDEILRKGFQGLRVDEVLKVAGLTKGAFYHHFTSKQALGYAIIDEVLYERMREQWQIPLLQADNPIDAIIDICKDAREDLTVEQMATGCPLNNLTQEMSPLDEGFRKRIAGVWELWIQAMADALRKGQLAGQVRTDIDAENVSRFVVSSIEGIIGQVKCFKCQELFENVGNCLRQYLDDLRA